MSYSLRPGDILKRPARYESEDDDTLPNSANLDAITDWEESDDPTNPTFGALHSQGRGDPFLPQSLASASHAAPNTSANHRVTLTANLSSDSRERRNVPEAEKRSIRPRRGMQQEGGRDDAPAGRKAGRQRKSAQNVSNESVTPSSNSLYPTEKPAAFPSLSAPPVATEDYPGNGMRKRVELIESGNEEGLTKAKTEVDALYNSSSDTWYQLLRTRWVLDESFASVTFTSLWPSLRQAIIEQIRDDFPVNTYHDAYLPVRRILGLSESTLRAIMTENIEDWDPSDSPPSYFREYRRLHPTAIIDPDEPPQPEVVKAIRFLKQQSLPGSLLGEWQNPLPPIEVFRPPTMFPSGKGFVDQGIVNRDNADAYSGPYLNTREQPNIPSPLQTQTLPSEDRRRSIKRPARIVRDKKPGGEKVEAKCRRCKQTGHRATDRDVQGKTKCPDLQAALAERARQVATLGATIDAEIADTNRRHEQEAATAKSTKAPSFASWLKNEADASMQPLAQTPVSSPQPKSLAWSVPSMLKPHVQGSQPASPFRRRLNAHTWFGAPEQNPKVTRASSGYSNVASRPQVQKPSLQVPSDSQYPVGTSIPGSKRTRVNDDTTSILPTPDAQPKVKRTYKKKEKQLLGPSAFLLAIPSDKKISLGMSKEATEVLRKGKGKAEEVVAVPTSKEKEMDIVPLPRSIPQERLNSARARAEVIKATRKDGDEEDADMLL